MNANYGAVVSAIVGTLAIVAYIVKLSVDYSRLKSKVEHLAENTDEAESEIEELEKDSREKINAIHNSVSNIEGRLNAFANFETKLKHVSDRQEEDRQKNSEKFAEFYSHRDETKETLIKLTSSFESMLKMFNERFGRIESQNASIEAQVRDLTRMFNELKYSARGERRAKDDD